jgi:phosphohistidine swiveling domain-containing protein
MVRSFDELAAGQQASAGSKGGTLARLYRAGYPVPEGFVVLPAAFAGDELRPGAWAQVRARLARMRKGDPDVTFAVRSSALSEDSACASFAGEFETLLDVRADGKVRQAIHAVRRSRHGERVQAYSRAQGLGTTHEMAVVVQRLVRADVAGVLFTADPITGSQVGMPGNYVYGPGERLVSGDANPEVFTLKRPRGEYEGPPALRRFARGLYGLASRLEEELGGPQDIEWAVVGRKLYLLQSRPITTLQAYNPATGEWNDSLTGDYLWTSANLGEAFPDVMTPFTWSFVQAYYRANGFRDEVARYPMGGNICGRPYMNLSVGLSASTALGLSREKVLRATAETFGLIPAGIEIPMIPFSRWRALRRFAPFAFRMRWRLRRLRRRIPFFIAETPARVDALKAAIWAVRTPHDLLDLWRERLYPLLDETMLMLAAGLTEYRTLSRRLHIEFERLVGEADANVLLSGVSTGTDYLASLGLLIGLSEVSQGTMSREAYLQRYGHRGPHEMELSAPRPAEDPGWLDRRLTEVKRDSVDVSRMLAEQRRQHEAAWARLEARVGRRTGGYRRKLDRMAEAARTREASRSETVRLLGVFRAFALQAGKLTGLGDDVFFLFLEEVVKRLAGDASACDAIPVRREAHAHYSVLPPYPTLIRGRFDPVRWAADPNRRSDCYDAYAPVPTAASATITGFAGAAGVVEGIVRRLSGPEEGDRLQPGEVLVAVATNVGWTPLFPRAAAIVTDVGAPFSHAAIVARELGIPAVIGCGDATMRLRTGDRVIVHGGQGIVEILDGDGR